MTLSHLEKLLKIIDPTLSVRMRGQGDVGGIFKGSQYILRVTKGELNLNGHRTTYFDEHGKQIQSRITKRGRKTVVSLLQKNGIINNLAERELILWGTGPLAAKLNA